MTAFLIALYVLFIWRLYRMSQATDRVAAKVAEVAAAVDIAIAKIAELRATQEDPAALQAIENQLEAARAALAAAAV